MFVNKILRKKVMVLVAILLAFIVFNEDVNALDDSIHCEYTVPKNSGFKKKYIGDSVTLSKSAAGVGDYKFADYKRNAAGSFTFAAEGEQVTSERKWVDNYTLTFGELGPKWTALIKCIDAKDCCPTIYLKYQPMGWTTGESLVIHWAPVSDSVAVEPKVTGNLIKDEDEEEKDEVNYCDDYDALEKALYTFINDKGLLAWFYNEPVYMPGDERIYDLKPTISEYYKWLIERAEKEYNEITGLSDGEHLTNSNFENAPVYKVFEEFLNSLDCVPNSRLAHDRKLRDALITKINGTYLDFLNKIQSGKDVMVNEEWEPPEKAEEIEEKIKEARERTKKGTEVMRQQLTTIMEDFISKMAGEKCTAILSDKLREKLQTYINWIRIIVPILLIMLGSVDMAKAVLIQEKTDDTNKAFNTFIKRCIIAVAIFFLPLVISYLIKQVNKVLPKDIRIDTFEDCELK